MAITPSRAGRALQQAVNTQEQQCDWLIARAVGPEIGGWKLDWFLSPSFLVTQLCNFLLRAIDSAYYEELEFLMHDGGSRAEGSMSMNPGFRGHLLARPPCPRRTVKGSAAPSVRPWGRGPRAPGLERSPDQPRCWQRERGRRRGSGGRQR